MVVALFCVLGVASAEGCEDGRLYQTGHASWYGSESHGQRTSGGDRFNMYAFTAAHKKLAPRSRRDKPIPICVRNIKNGKTVKVLVTDSGPYVDGRVLDLSYAAAKEIGLGGVGKVQIYLYD